ncbi:hypothetical protein LPJ61_004636 [Coemansia biformis]|uniref:AAA+ ATPase domain-containing protein n=1 Tax=Coemansia biformis TaxID=1286918 RepID=A0A9W7YAA7_9FUNG|nr:hypothetical protein LPJ61_004636 [Coemansia biformis]
MVDCAAIRCAVRAEVGGLDDAVDALVAKFADYYASRSLGASQRAPGTARTAGAILSGIPGCGKTRLAATFAQATGLPHRTVNCPDLFSSDQGGSEARLIDCFAAPAGDAGADNSGMWVLVLEEIDVLAGSRRPDTLEARMLSLLLDCMDASCGFVVGTTSLPAAIPEEMRRPGRLDASIDLHLARPADRAVALRLMLRGFSRIADCEEDIARVAKQAHGFSAADLQSLCARAFMAHREAMTADDLVRAARGIRPSNLSALQSKIPHVRFSDVFGLDEAIDRMRSLIVEPLLRPERYQEMQVEAPRGALVHGPPGTGKSLLCCALANELAVNTIWADATQLRSMIVGESEQAVANLFAQARKSTPCILLFDHIDALVPRRGTSQSSENTSDRIVTSFLVEMDGFSSQGPACPGAPGVFVLAVTSRPQTVDPAILRPGRLDVHIGLERPTAEQRKAILTGILGRMPAAAGICDDSVSIRELVARTEGYTGADLANLCREAALAALRRDIRSEKVRFGAGKWAPRAYLRPAQNIRDM